MTNAPEGLFCYDSREFIKHKVPDNSVDLVVTSPPYDDMRDWGAYGWGGNAIGADPFRPLAVELYRVIKPGGVVVWVVGDRTKNGHESGTSFRQALFFVDQGFNLFDTMIYVKSGTGAAGSNKGYWQAFEYMFILSKGKPKTVNLLHDVPNKFAGERTVGGRVNKNNQLKDRKSRVIQEYSKRTNVWQYRVGNNNGDDRTGHPAPFPEELAHDHIVSWSNPGDFVMDPFLGSGTTVKWAQKLNRRFLGIDVNREYVEMSRRRLET